MPTVIVSRDQLFRYIGETYTDEKFDEICFEFGIELDEVTSEKEMFQNEQGKVKEGLSTEVLYKIEVPANRYDLLCIEGLALALRVFLGKSDIPEYTPIVREDPVQFLIDESVESIRPFGLSAILRDISFTEETLIGFMELQEKLHHNICRGRTLVSMGTHDLDSVEGPFYYRTLHRDTLQFVPLNRTEKMNGTELLNALSTDPKLKNYVALLANEEHFPAVMDSKGVVMAIPPLINSEHSKIKVSTKNVFIDITAKDLTKANIVLNTLVAMFSYYCKTKFTVEQVKVVTPSGKSKLYPNIEKKVFIAEEKYLNRIAGTDLSLEEIAKLLLRMGLRSKVVDKVDEKVDDKSHSHSQSQSRFLHVEAPITRSDILHPCDIAEDLAISYGYNNIIKRKPTTICNGKQQPINKLSDLIRQEMALSGYVECLTMALISKKDMYTNLLVEVNEQVLAETVQIYKSKVPEYELFRRSLIPGILKTIEANKANQLPYKVFEISDVVLIDEKSETGAVNKRRICFAYTNTTSGLEIVQGLVDHLMLKFGLTYEDREKGYYIEPSYEKFLFEDRQAHLYVRGVKAGVFGIVHPKVLKNFSIKTPVSIAEIDIDYIFSLVIKGEILKGSY